MIEFEKPIVVKTVNGMAPDVNGNIDVANFPDQADNAGKYLTTDGTTPKWAEVVSTTITYWE